MNPFLADIDGADYDSGRPYFHQRVFERMAHLFSDVNTALDVACGTGQSTVALRGISKTTIGLDASPRMLGCARGGDGIRYMQGCAEHLPFRDGSFDILTVALGLHWLERDMFLREAARVLRRGGWLMIYDSGTCGRMKENGAFGEWIGMCRQRFPPPPRNDEAISPEILTQVGFVEAASDGFVHCEVCDLDRLVRYWKTQSNVILAAHRGQDVTTWLRSTLEPLFETDRATFEYDAWSQLFRKAR